MQPPLQRGDMVSKFTSRDNYGHSVLHLLESLDAEHWCLMEKRIVIILTNRDKGIYQKLSGFKI